MKITRPRLTNKGFPCLILILISALFIPLSCALTGVEHRWNFIVYMAGDNNLENFGILDLNEMEAVGSTADVAVFVLFDRAPGYTTSNDDWTTTRLYRVNFDAAPVSISSEMVADFGERDMSDPATLRDFIIECNRLSPARYTCLTLWDHGDGVFPKSLAPPSAPTASHTDTVTRGIANDWTTGSDIWDCLTADEVKLALSQARAATGKKVDVVNMDACSMQMLELAWEWQGETDYLAGSEALVPGIGNNYTFVLRSLTRNAFMTPEELAFALVEEYYNEYKSSAENTTYSALRLGSEFNTLKTAFSSFAAALNGTPAGNLPAVLTSWTNATSFAKIEYKDLYDFADKTITTPVADAAVTSAAAALKTAIDDVVLNHRNTGTYVTNESLGIAILLANSATWVSSYAGPGRYPTFLLSTDTAWNEFIARFAAFN